MWGSENVQTTFIFGDIDECHSIVSSERIQTQRHIYSVSIYVKLKRDKTKLWCEKSRLWFPLEEKGEPSDWYQQRDLQGSGGVPVLDPVISWLYSLCKFIELYTYDLCTYLYIGCTSINGLFNNM